MDTKYNIPKQFTIKRSKWVRGDRNLNVMGSSRLFNQYGNKCCLGFFSLACGATENEIDGRYYLYQSKNNDFSIPILPFDDSELRDIARANDDPKLSQEDLEEYLIKTFKERDIEVNFID